MNWRTEARHLSVVGGSIGFGYFAYSMARAAGSDMAWGYFSLGLFVSFWAMAVLEGMAYLWQELHGIREALEDKNG